MQNAIRSAILSPQSLEALYQADSVEFKRAFSVVFKENADSVILQVWNERLHFEAMAHNKVEAAAWNIREVSLVIVMALVAGTLARTSDIFSWLNREYIYTRFLAWLVLLPLAVIFWTINRLRPRFVLALLALFLVGPLYMAILPNKPQSQSIALACLHLPILYWSLLGVSFLGARLRDSKARMEYIRYNGELIVYSTVIVVGGVVLTSLTFGLFSLLNLSIEEWYMSHVGVYGLVATPLVATLLITRIVGVRLRVASMVAKIFTPLFLLMVIAFFVAIVVMRKSPYQDRDFLLAFNGLLLIVLALAAFAIAGRMPRQPRSPSDFMNLALIVVTLALDLVALSAIVFRLNSYGFSPNRVAVLGANLLVFGHLLGLLVHYFHFIRGLGSLERVERWITSYIPMYTVWCSFVALAFPWLFRLR
jgi:hypothetical protein